jgi:O-antigen ligase
MFLTGARAAFSGLVVGLAIVFLIGESKYRTVGLIGGAFGYLLILLFGQYFPLFNRGESYAESFEFRNHIWGEAMDIYRKNPVLGIGIGNYQNYVSLYSPDQFWFMPEGEIMYFDHPESGYLKMLTEYGTIGFALICSFVLIPIASAVINFFNKLADNRIFYFIGGKD